MMTIAGSVQEKKSLRMPQDRFSRGGWLLRYPPFRGASSTPSIMRLTFFANAKTMWTLPLLWTQRTRPQEFGNLAKNARFPQRPHRSSFSLKAKKEEQNHSDQLSTKSDHPHGQFGDAACRLHECADKADTTRLRPKRASASIPLSAGVLAR